MNQKQISELLYTRQHLTSAAGIEEYDQLFKMMSPVPTLFWIEPGSAPQIQHRCEFDDYEANNFSRKSRHIIKGRFQNGRVGYVLQDELPLFMAAYSKSIKYYTEHETMVLNILKREGPMNIGLIKEISGLLSKEISKALQRLQKAFIVFEDQIDLDNDRAWYLLEDELSELELNQYTRESAMEEVFRRFMFLNVFVNEKMIKSFTGFTNKDIKETIVRLLDKGIIVPQSIDDKTGYVLASDQDSMDDLGAVNNKIYILDLNDYLVKSNELMLKSCFPKTDYKTLHYIYTQGVFIGRVLGYFRFGPNDVEDVELLDVDTAIMPDEQAIIQSVNHNYNYESNRLKRFQGRDL